ncbi:MAG: esterase-like activity of phytase family protein, partial [Hyphomicrobiaceae bacterium]
MANTACAAAILAIVLVPAVLVPAAVAKPRLKGLKSQDIAISARPIRSFGKTHKPGRAAGKLTWLGGLILTSPSGYFGGFSGLSISPDGTRIFA